MSSRLALRPAPRGAAHGLTALLLAAMVLLPGAAATQAASPHPLMVAAMGTLSTDQDGDGVLDENDNCPTVPNANQADGDSDDLGDVCEALDLDFGDGGKQQHILPGSATLVADAHVIAADGRIWQIGRQSNQIAILIYDADGNIVGNDEATSPLLQRPHPTAATVRIRAAAAQGYDIVMAGQHMDGSGQQNPVLVRLNADGSLDSGFGSAGWKLETGVPQCGTIRVFWGMAVQNVGGEDRILALCGSSVIRYTADGALDTSFGVDGVRDVTAGTGTLAGIGPVAVGPDGKITVAGTDFAAASAGWENIFLARLTSGGELDPTFGTGGRSSTDFTGEMERTSALSIGPNGLIAVSGIKAMVGQNDVSNDAFVARFDAHGRPDASFGDDGFVAGFDVCGLRDEGVGVAQRADGKVMLAVLSIENYACGSADHATDFMLYAVNPDGTLDTDYATNGRDRADFYTSFDLTRKMSVQPDGKLVVSGDATLHPLSWGFGIARFLPPALAPDWDGDDVDASVDTCVAIANADQTDTDGDSAGNACDSDDDNDGTADASDAFPLDPTETLDTDGDGIGNNADPDDDNDGVADPDDNCPLTANAGQTDTDVDGAGDACDADDDGDGVPDATDNCPLTVNADQADADDDGIGDACDPVNDPDTDGDGVRDSVDICPTVANPLQEDLDLDLIGDACDDDDDGDGILDAEDNCPLEANAGQGDNDDDGQGDACDADDDNDGVIDMDDNCPFHDNPEQYDTDADGIGDECDPDDDNDGVADADDNCPFTPNGDQLDSDGDLAGNVCDPDDDNDGVLDPDDNCPTTANAGQGDNEGDGQGDACDPDDDNDGVMDPDDNCPLTANPSQADIDTDGIGDACDPVNNNDTDGDGVPDSIDNCTSVANPSQADQDTDGIGDACDGDVDGDGIANAADNCPTEPNAGQTDTDGDGAGNACDADDDNDGVLDAADNCPLAANATQADHDGDGSGDACDVDDDNDGVADTADPFPTSNTAPAIVVGTCTTGVSNQPLGDGSTMLDRIGACAAGAADHGEWVSCVTSLTNDWKKAGRITGAQKGAITSCAAQADVP